MCAYLYCVRTWICNWFALCVLFENIKIFHFMVSVRIFSSTPIPHAKQRGWVTQLASYLNPLHLNLLCRWMREGETVATKKQQLVNLSKSSVFQDTTKSWWTQTSSLNLDTSCSFCFCQAHTCGAFIFRNMHPTITVYLLVLFSLLRPFALLQICKALLIWLLVLDQLTQSVNDNNMWKWLFLSDCTVLYLHYLT